MHYNFVEIGTSNFDTLIQKASSTDVGLSVDIIKSHLQDLPNKPNVTKVHCGVSPDNILGKVKTYHIPVKVLMKNKLPLFLRGCNCINDYHPSHISQNLKEFVVIEEVICVPISALFEKYHITSLDYLKIDTEGADVGILTHFLDYIKSKGRELYPKKILFEANGLVPKEQVDELVAKYLEIGYKTKKFAMNRILVL
jgi:hypothetical protein